MNDFSSISETPQNSTPAGRFCPSDYRLSDRAFAGEPSASCEVLYVAGGMYGNPFAFDALHELVHDEHRETKVVLNGDIHWFDKTADNFALIEQKAQDYVLLAGNVEVELRRDTETGAGCGCAYPACVSDEVVNWSNQIHHTLFEALNEHDDLKLLLRDRPAALSVSVSGKNIAITHGDEKLVGGWDCSREALQNRRRQEELCSWMKRNRIALLATSHTCAPAALALPEGFVVNNGAAGIPNFSGQLYGLVIRIASQPHPDALFGARLDDLFVGAVPLRYDQSSFLAWFDELWEKESPAALSYRNRIVNGPDDQIGNALLGGFTIS